MNFEQYDYRIAGHFASAIVNGDYSGLEEEDIKQLDAFIESLPAGAGHWSGFNDETANFARCDVCGEYAEVYDAAYLVQS